VIALSRYRYFWLCLKLPYSLRKHIKKLGRREYDLSWEKGEGLYGWLFRRARKSCEDILEKYTPISLIATIL